MHRYGHRCGVEAEIVKLTRRLQIEADDASVTSDYYEQSLNSSTQSLTSSIQKHVYENGRRYHACSDGKYALPSDESEQDRLDFVSCSP